MSSARTALVWGFATVGLLFCGFCAYRILDARFYQARESMRLEEALRVGTTRDESVLPAGRPPRKAGSLVGRLDIPRLHMSAIVLEGADEKTLDRGVGRISATADPGEAGNVVLGGHRDTFFRPLRGIRRGDAIAVTTPAGRFRYRVEWTQVVRPEETGVLMTTPDPVLTLVTCYPFRYLGSAPQRFIVRARQVVESSANQ
jgi:sortase A